MIVELRLHARIELQFNLVGTVNIAVMFNKTVCAGQMELMETVNIKVNIECSVFNKTVCAGPDGTSGDSGHKSEHRMQCCVI